MPSFNPSHLTGTTMRPAMFHTGFSYMASKDDKTEEPTVSGSGLEKISDKLEKFIVKPRRKLKNIQFNP